MQKEEVNFCKREGEDNIIDQILYRSLLTGLARTSGDNVHIRSTKKEREKETETKRWLVGLIAEFAVLLCH